MQVSWTKAHTVVNMKLLIMTLLLLQVTDSLNIKGRKTRTFVPGKTRKCPKMLLPSVLVDAAEFNNLPDYVPSLATKCSLIDEQFRTANGSCNNLKHPSWGQADSPYVRLIPSSYDDEKDIPRQIGTKLGLLPSARTVSKTVHTSVSTLSDKSTYMVMQWGQFLDHDISATPTEKVNNSLCCEGITTKYTYKEGGCYPIVIDKGDPFFKTNCFAFTRSKAPDASKPRQQMNIITAFIDASMVYGSSEEDTEVLRSGKDGLLLTGKSGFLPENKDTACKKQEAEFYCFLAGDERVNVFPGLSALHTLFLRFHNKIAYDLKSLSSLKTLFPLAKLTDEDLFQMTRKIVSAVIQQITYREYLPVVLGKPTMSYYKLSGDYKYDPNINPTVINAFATAAFRFGHSLIRDSMHLGGKDVPIHELFFNTKPVISNMSEVLLGLVGVNGEKGDQFVSKEMTEHLFQTSKGSLDIVALNIQRGRDHGLPPFNDYRVACGLSRLTSLGSSEFGTCVKALGQVYDHVDDVDLFVGGLCEPHIKNGILGPTFTCLMAKQFHNLKFGDRFFYKNTRSPAGFTEGQLKMLKRITLSKLLCDFGGLKSIQPNVFLSDKLRGNEMKPCTSIPLYLRSLFNM